MLLIWGHRQARCVHQQASAAHTRYASKAATAAATMVCVGAWKLSASEGDEDGALAGVAVGRSLPGMLKKALRAKETVRKTEPRRLGQELKQR
jgi:hypothetical protein